MAKDRPRTEEEQRQLADARLSTIPIPCMHCKHIQTMGTQFSPEGWSCPAFPEQIPYTILTLRHPHDEVRMAQQGDEVYTPKMYREHDTGKVWHYTADGGWVYAEE